MTATNGFRLMIMAMFLIASLGCAAHKPIMPTMDLPPEPVKPKIQSKIVPYEGNFLVGYPLADSLALYEFLLRKDAYEEKLRYRIETMNQLLGGK